MWKIKPTPDQYQKYFKVNSNLKPVPKEWETFVSLTTIRSGGSMVQFVPFDYQKLLVSLMQQYNNLVVVKSRQLGTTQAVSSKFLHNTCLNPASSSVAFMRNGDDVGSLSRRLKQMLVGLEGYVQTENDAVGYIKLKGLGDFYIKNSSREGIRSIDSVTNLLFDEAAFVPTIEQIYAASSPSGALVGDGITKIIVSTPSAKSGWYWNKLNDNNGNKNIEEICEKVAIGELYKDIPGLYYFEDEAGCCKLILHWRVVPNYLEIDNSFEGGYLAYRQKQDGTDEETIAREYDLRFIDSSVSVFTAELVRSNIKAKSTINIKPNSNARYYMGLDTSTIGSDYLAAPIIEELNGQYTLVDYYRRRKETSQTHIYHLGQLIRKWEPIGVGVEITGGVGQLYLEQLSKEFKSISFEAIRTTSESKPAMVSTLMLALERHILNYPEDNVLIDELLSFRREGAKLEASPGKTDDLVMALCFGLSVTPFAKSEEKPFFSDVPGLRGISR